MKRMNSTFPANYYSFFSKLLISCVFLLLINPAYGFFDYEIRVQKCKNPSEPSNISNYTVTEIILPTSLLDVTVINKTRRVLKIWWEAELECPGETKSVFLDLQESEAVVAADNSSSVASRGIWEPRANVTFTTGGLLQIGENVLYSNEICLNGFTESQLEISYCDAKCEDVAKVCISKCCGPYQRITHDEMHCSAGSWSGYPYWFSLYSSAHTQISTMDQEKDRNNYMKFTRPDLTKYCKPEQIRSVSFSNIPINGSKGFGYLQRVLNDGSIIFPQSPVHWRRLLLPEKGNYCVDTFFKSNVDEKYKEYKTEELHAIFWCPENDEEDLRPSVIWEVAVLLISCLFYIVPHAFTRFHTKNGEAQEVHLGVLFLGACITAWNIIQVVCYLCYPFSGSGGDSLVYKVIFEFLLELSFMCVVVCLITINTNVYSSKRGNESERNSCTTDMTGLTFGIFLSLMVTISLAVGVQQLAPEFLIEGWCFTDTDCRYYYVTISVALMWIVNLLFTVLNIQTLKFESTTRLWGQLLHFMPLVALVYILELINYWVFGEATPELLWIALIIFKALIGPWYLLCFWNILSRIFKKGHTDNLELQHVPNAQRN